MRRCVCVFGLLVLLMTSAGAKETVLPGLIRAPMAIAIDLPDGRKVTLEGLVIRPDRPGRFPLVVLIHGTPRGDGPAFFATIARQSPARLNGPVGCLRATRLRSGLDHAPRFRTFRGAVCRKYLRNVR